MEPRLVPIMELVFQEQYKALCRHVWFGDGYILAGFASGGAQS